MLYPKTNVYKLRNGVLLSVCMFSRWSRNHTDSYIAVDLLFNVPQNICGVLCLSLFYYASLCVLSIFVNTLTSKRIIDALL